MGAGGRLGRKAMTKAGKGKEEVCLGDKPVRGNSLKREQGKDIACPHHPLSLHSYSDPVDHTTAWFQEILITDISCVNVL